MMFGKVLETTRLVSWYGKRNFTYKYSNKEKVALPYPQVLEDIHSMVEKNNRSNLQQLSSKFLSRW